MTGADDDLRNLDDRELVAVRDELERRRPGAAMPAVGARPRRRPWTYRDIWRLEAVKSELARRRLSD